MSELLHKSGAALVADEINEVGSLKAFVEKKRKEGYILSEATICRWLKAQGWQVEKRWVPVKTSKAGNEKAARS